MKPQSGPRHLALISAGCAAFLILQAVAVVNSYEWMDVLMDTPGVYALGCGAMAICSSVMLSKNCDNARSHGLLIAAILFAVMNAVIFVVSLWTHRVSIFDSTYIASMGLVLPGLAMTALLVTARRSKKFDPIGVLGLAISIGCVAFAHVWIIAAAAFSV